MRMLLLFCCLLTCACAGQAEDAAVRGRYRKVQRAYDGAPPVIPHAVVKLQRQDCLSCHQTGLRLDDGRLAARTPHAEQINCLQCHVEPVTPRDWIASNRFEGLRHPPRGGRAYPGAPPTVPHPMETGRNCLGCHDRLGGSPIRSPHPDRVNCLQCHVPMRGDLAEWRGNTFPGEP